MMGELHELTRDELASRLIAATKRLDSLVSEADTGLPGRRLFLERAAAETRRARRYERPLALVMLRLVPGLTGDAASDGLRVLAISQMAQSVLRDGIDMAGRLETDLFAVLLPETDLTGALTVAERLRTTAARLELPHDRGTCRVAFACAADSLLLDDDRFATVLRRATRALDRSLGTA